MSVSPPQDISNLGWIRGCNIEMSPSFFVCSLQLQSFAPCQQMQASNICLYNTKQLMVHDMEDWDFGSLLDACMASLSGPNNSTKRPPISILQITNGRQKRLATIVIKILVMI